VASIHIDNLSKAYGNLVVLQDFSLQIADGEFIVLVGPSGCGKSTTLRILAGLEEASGGEITIDGRDVTNLAPGKRDIAMVFQSYALYPHLTVRRNMGFGLRMRGLPTAEINRRVEEVARTLAIEHLLDRWPKALSGGQRQRVALGRAIVREPQAFLMDEPLSNLDTKLRVRMRAEIIALHRRLGVTTVYVTHDQTEAMTMADRIVIMNEGKIQQIATPERMFAEPANVFVAGFIGSPSMNFLEASVAPDGTASLSLFGQPVPLPHAGLGSQLSSGRVIVGIRPEHIRAGEGRVAFDAPVRLVESLGDEKYVYVEVPPENRTGLTVEEGEGAEDVRSDTLIARLVGSVRMPSDGTIRLSFDPANLHLFDSKTLESIRVR
jgi:multiple sugar transport system ATP-binding protein